MKRLVRVLVLLNAVWPELLVSGWDCSGSTNNDAFQPKGLSDWTYSTSETSGTKDIKSFSDVFSRQPWYCDKPYDDDCKGYLVSDLEAAGYSGGSTFD